MHNKIVHLGLDQIDHIRKLIHGRGCHYLDLQSEIVDHIACAVEAKLVEYPNLSFDSALKSIFHSLPATGFHNIVNEKKHHSSYIGEKYCLERQVTTLLYRRFFC